MNTIEKLIKECEHRLSEDKPAYKMTIPCDWLVQQLQAAQKESGAKWISIKDKDLSHLKEGDMVLTTDGKNNVIPYVFILGGLNMIGEHRDNNRKITHWMQIPATPK